MAETTTALQCEPDEVRALLTRAERTLTRWKPQSSSMFEQSVMNMNRDVARLAADWLVMREALAEAEQAMAFMEKEVSNLAEYGQWPQNVQGARAYLATLSKLRGEEPEARDDRA